MALKCLFLLTAVTLLRPREESISGAGALLLCKPPSPRGAAPSRRSLLVRNGEGCFDTEQEQSCMNITGVSEHAATPPSVRRPQQCSFQQQNPSQKEKREGGPLRGDMMTSEGTIKALCTRHRGKNSTRLGGKATGDPCNLSSEGGHTLLE